MYTWRTPSTHCRVSIKTVVRVRCKRCLLSPSSDFRPDDCSVPSLPQHGNSNISRMWTKRCFERKRPRLPFANCTRPSPLSHASGIRKSTSSQGQDRYSRLPRRVRVSLRAERPLKCLPPSCCAPAHCAVGVDPAGY